MTPSPLRHSTKRLLALLLLLLLLPLPLLLLGEWWRVPAPRGGPAPRPVTILLWHWPFGVAQDLEGDPCLALYRVPRCRLLSNRSAFPAADVVVFHNRELAEGGSLPRHLPRPPGQRWAWMSLESPAHNGDLRPLAGLFNLTVSYRRDADVTVPYGKLVPRGPGDEEPALHNKSVPVCWVVSNYSPGHRRGRVHALLREAVPVTVYGRWSRRSLSPEDLLPTISRCYFYLALENSEARDYITEKLWRNAFQSGAVPVVLGPPAGDYGAVAPRGSFLHVDDFASVGALGRRLRELLGDRRRYEAFLRWRRDWSVKLYDDWRERLCSICARYERLPAQKVYGDLEAWARA